MQFQVVFFLNALLSVSLETWNRRAEVAESKGESKEESKDESKDGGDRRASDSPSKDESNYQLAQPRLAVSAGPRTPRR